MKRLSLKLLSIVLLINFLCVFSSAQDEIIVGGHIDWGGGSIGSKCIAMDNDNMFKSFNVFIIVNKSVPFENIDLDMNFSYNGQQISKISTLPFNRNSFKPLTLGFLACIMEETDLKHIESECVDNLLLKEITVKLDLSNVFSCDENPGVLFSLDLELVNNVHGCDNKSDLFNIGDHCLKSEDINKINTKINFCCITEIEKENIKRNEGIILREISSNETLIVQTLNISPNPTNDFIVIESLVFLDEELDIEITNLYTGEIVNNNEAYFLENGVIDVSSYISGIYTIRILYENKLILGNFVKI